MFQCARKSVPELAWAGTSFQPSGSWWEGRVFNEKIASQVQNEHLKVSRISTLYDALVCVADEFHNLKVADMKLQVVMC